MESLFLNFLSQDAFWPIMLIFTFFVALWSFCLDVLISGFIFLLKELIRFLKPVPEITDKQES